MILLFVQGMTLALPATITPGPYQAFLLSHTLRDDWRRTLPAAWAPLITDGPIIALVLFLLTQTPPWFLRGLRVAGGLFILYLAVSVLRSRRTAETLPTPATGAATHSLGKAVIMNFLNPNPYIHWSVIAGPILLGAWRRSPAEGIAFLLGFYATFVLGLSLLVLAFGTAGRVNARINRLMTLISGLALLGFGIYQIVGGFR